VKKNDDLQMLRSKAGHLGKEGYFCNFEKQWGYSAIFGQSRGKNAIFPIFISAPFDHYYRDFCEIQWQSVALI
jgi:hypothetical protein